MLKLSCGYISKCMRLINWKLQNNVKRKESTTSMSFHIDRLEPRTATLPEVAYSFQHILYQNSNGGNWRN